MNLLDTASLVVTPNGYKASKLYSIIPSDGSGDMTFARTGDTATRVNSSGLIEVDAANIPRLDYLGSTCPKLLLEPQRTNVCLNSEAISASTGTTVSENVAVSPSGATNADKLVEDTSTGIHIMYLGGSLGGTVDSSMYVVSVYAKAAGRTRFRMFDNNQNTSGETFFDLSTGTVVSGSGKIEYFGNGYYRCSIYPLKNYSTVSSAYAFLVNSGTNTSYTGDGTSGIIFWGLQVEAGAYATSYIPTTTASVTRNADNCSKTSISSLIGQTEGTIFIDVNIIAKTSTSINILNSGKNILSSFYIVHTSANKIRAGVFNNSASIIELDSINTFTLNNRAKIALRYKSGQSTLYLNGVQQASSTATFTFIQSISDLFLGETVEYFAVNENIKINSVALWKTGLQNAELATLTSL